jgi:predicted metalloprotease with PDZ domain
VSAHRSIITRVIRAHLAATLAIFVTATVPPGPVLYRLTLDTAGDSTISISMTLPDDPVGPLTLIIPRAVPMGYSQQLYDRYVSDVSARGTDSVPMNVERKDGSRWQIGTTGARVRQINYRVDLARMERELLSATDSSRARSGYAGILGYSVFGYLEGWEGRAVRLEVEAPADWPVFTTLAPVAPPARGRTTADAPDFYTLADSQVTMGPGLTVTRLESRVPLYLSAYAEGAADVPFTGSLVARAMNALVDYFGSAPFAHYSAVLELLKPVSPEHGYGFSMEHLSSSHYCLEADAAVTPASPEAQRRRALYNFAHHIAHAWVPKRAYGEGYFPFTWELAPIIDSIWLSEGFARFLAIEALADQMPEAEAIAYRKTMSDSQRATLVDIPLFIRDMPLVDLSRIASTRYSEDFRTGRTLFAKGALLAAELDQHIREASGGRKRFRDAAIYLMKWSEEHKRGFRVDELPAIFQQATGVDSRSVWDRWLPPRR